MSSDARGTREETLIIGGREAGWCCEEVGLSVEGEGFCWEGGEGDLDLKFDETQDQPSMFFRIEEDRVEWNEKFYLETGEGQEQRWDNRGRAYDTGAVDGSVVILVRCRGGVVQRLGIILGTIACRCAYVAVIWLPSSVRIRKHS